jgi:hypothetical protein
LRRKGLSSFALPRGKAERLFHEMEAGELIGAGIIESPLDREIDDLAKEM